MYLIKENVPVLQRLDNHFCCYGLAPNVLEMENL